MTHRRLQQQRPQPWLQVEHQRDNLQLQWIDTNLNRIVHHALSAGCMHNTLITAYMIPFQHNTYTNYCALACQKEKKVYFQCSAFCLQDIKLIIFYKAVNIARKWKFYNKNYKVVNTSHALNLTKMLFSQEPRGKPQF